MRRALAAALATALLATGTLAGSGERAVEWITTDDGRRIAVINEIDYVKSGDALIRVEIIRPDDGEQIPVILGYSPYNSTSETNPTVDGGVWVAKGYAYAQADVLGTRGSTGCWDYGGLLEQQSGVDVVNHLSSREFSNGNVGMIGVSYDGTTANMVAAAGERAPGLKAIVPIAAISHWYGYAYHEGVRYFLNSFSPTNEGFDTPLLFDFGFGRTVPADSVNDPQYFADLMQDRIAECGSAEHTMRAYDPTPDQDAFWKERSYTENLSDWRAATLVVHGWQDYNVKQDEAIRLYENLPVDDPTTAEVEGVAGKMLWMTQATHASGSGDGYHDLVDAWFAEHLKEESGAVSRWHREYGQKDDAGNPKRVRTAGRTIDGEHEVNFHRTWPPESTSTVDLHLGRWFDYDLGSPVQSGLVGSDGETGVLSLEQQETGAWTWVDGHNATELMSEDDPLNEPGHGYYSLYYQTPELAQDVRIAGRAQVDGWFRFQNASNAHLTPILMDIAPNGNLRVAERCFLNVDFREGREIGEPGAANQWLHAPVNCLPEDYTFKAGHRIALLLMSTNTIWAVPGTPAGMVNVANGMGEGDERMDTILKLPVVDAPADLSELFVEPAPTAPGA